MEPIEPREDARSAEEGLLRRDTIVIGASAGGIEAIGDLLARLPADLPAAVLVVQHRAASRTRLAEVLGRCSALPVLTVGEPQPVRPGYVYVADAARHMALVGDQVVPNRGPRENRARPSINVLFRTAAAARASRVVGVLLTGLLDDGVAGMDAIRRCGGLTLVQDPREALYPDLPRNALDAGCVDDSLPIAELARALIRHCGATVAPAPVPRELALEAEVSATGVGTASALEAVGEMTSLACPECGGPLWQSGLRDAAIYRCHTGHALSPRVLLDAQNEEVERALWSAVRALDERARMLGRLTAAAEERGSRLACRYDEDAAETRRQVEQARAFLLSLRLDRTDEVRRDAEQGAEENGAAEEGAV